MTGTGLKLTGFPKTLEKALEEHKLDYARRLFSDPKYAEQIKNNAWDIIHVLTKHLTEASERFDCCNDLLKQVAEYSDPEDALLQIFAEMETSIDITQFLALLEPFQTALLRLKGKRASYIPKESFNMFAAFIHKLPLPNYTGFDARERLVVDNDDTVSNVVHVVSKVFDVNKNLISKINIAQTDVESWIHTLVMLLGRPLCFLNINLHNNVKTEAGLLSENIVATIFKFTRDPAALFYNQHEVKLDYRLGLANLFYFVYYEQTCLDQTPKVYRAEFMFEKSIEPICWLLQESSESEIMVEKALKLAKALINYLHNLTYLYLECYYQRHFCILLSNKILLNSNKDIRKMALDVLTLYCSCFEHKGFYLIVRNLLKEVSHAGLKGYMINLYKDRLAKEFQIQQEDNLPEYFKGAKLHSLLRQCCDLDEEKTMLPNQFDQIVSTLNLLRYLAIRDKTNATSFWNFVPTLKNIYLKPLQSSINACKYSQEAEVNKIQNEKFPVSKKSPEVSVTVGGSDLPKMGPEVQLKELNMGLVLCDQVQSLVDRLNELLAV